MTTGSMPSPQHPPPPPAANFRPINQTLAPTKSKSTTTTRKPPPAGSAFNRGTKRRSGHDSDDSDDGFTQSSKVQLVSGFDAVKGAISLDGDEDKKGGPLVIPAIKNKDWRMESMKRKKAIYIPPEAQKGGQHGVVEGGGNSERVGGEFEAENAGKYGLQVAKKSEVEVEVDGDTKMVDNLQSTPTDVPAAPPPKKTEDELALEALLSGENPKKKSDLVLAMQSADTDWRDARGGPHNEEDAYKMDIASRPDVPSLEDYEAVPVEEFGAALLRGMGWKEGQELGKRGGEGRKLKKVEKRPAFLGLGAKATSVAEELGSWGKGAKGKRGYVDKTYNPVVLKNKATGEILDKLPEQKKNIDEPHGRSKGGSDRELDYGSRRKETPMSSSSRDDRNGDRRRDRSKDDEDRRRRRDKDEHPRYEKRTSERDRSQDRNRDRREKDYERDRDRDRDYKKDHRHRERGDRDRDDGRDSHRDRERERERDRRHNSRERGSSRR